MKSRTKSKQQKGFFSRIFRKVFSCIAPLNENPKLASRRSRRVPEPPKKPERHRDMGESVRISLRGPFRGHKEGPRRHPLFETSQHSTGKHGGRLDSESYQFPSPEAIPLFVPIATVPGYSAQESSTPMRYTSSEIDGNNTLTPSKYAHASAIDAPKCFPDDQEWLLPVDDVHLGTLQPNDLSFALATWSDNGADLEAQGVIGLGIQNISCGHPTIADQDMVTISDSAERPLSPVWSTTSEACATIGESCPRRQGEVKGVPGFNSLPRYRPAPKVAPDPMWRAPCPAPMPPGLGDIRNNSSTSSDHTTNRSAASSASSLPMEIHSPYETDPGLPQVDRLYVRNAGPIELGNISSWVYAFPIPALMLPTMFTPPPSSHSLHDNQSEFNAMPTNPEEPRVYPAQPWRNGARRKRERRALGIGGNPSFVERDMRVTINGAKPKNWKNSTMRMELSVQRGEVTRSASGPQAKARSRRGWGEREGTRFGGIRDGKENLVLAEGGANSTSHQYGRAGRSHRTRAEMQPTVESAPTSVVGCFV